MTPARESIVIPLLFLTVTLLGGLRIAAGVTLTPPSLTALILALVLIGTLVRGGAFNVLALLNGGRSGLENVSGSVVLICLFAATAQAINLLLPDRGLLHAAFAIFIFCQLLTMTAARTDRPGMLRSLGVLLGSLFVLRYIIVESLYAPDRGLLHRVLTAMLSGASLGGIVYEPHAPVTGYVAFFTLMLYVVGLLLLPTTPATMAMIRRTPTGTALPSTLAMLIVLGVVGCGGADEKPAADKEAEAAKPVEGLVSAERRAAALRSAQVWREPSTPVPQADLKSNPTGKGAFKDSDVVSCRLVIKAMGGTTPKFDCELPGGETIRVKYGRGNPELHAEVAATRLLAALGFGADRMYVVRTVRCAGCTGFPFHSLRCLAETGIERACFPSGLDHGKTTDFDHAVIERRLEGRRIEAVADQGWAWYEIDQVSASAGGAPRAHVDAIKLMAMVIAHWDNKAENQRLICLPGGDQPDGGCTRPLAMLQDLGASFGPTKLDLHNWRSTGVWKDPRACLVSMEQLPWGGATFPEQQISEAGRQFLIERLDQLSEGQLVGLFEGARVESSEGLMAESRQPKMWAAAFLDKVRQIREAGPCPANPPPPAR
jgi:hypothetical protein